MESLEQKVLDLLVIQGELNACSGALKQELAPLQEQLQKVKERHDVPARSLASRITTLKGEILAAMTEKTHKFECATIQKRTTPRLKVLNGLKLFRQLEAKECIDRVTFGFNDKQIRTLIEGGAIKTGDACEVITSESLVVK